MREARQDTLPIYDVKSWVMDEGAAAFNVTKPLSFTREASLTSPADSRAAGFRFATHYTDKNPGGTQFKTQWKGGESI